MGTTVVWLRDDLRLADNPALHEAAQRGGQTAVLYVLDESAGVRPLGAEAVLWNRRYGLPGRNADAGLKGWGMDPRYDNKQPTVTTSTTLGRR